jgi:hypothetical protein
MPKEIKVQPSNKMKAQKAQAKVHKKAPLGKEIMTKKIPRPPVSKEETKKVNTAKIQPKENTPYIGETWVEKKASSKDGKKRRCLITLVFSEGGITYVQSVSRLAHHSYKNSEHSHALGNA